MKLSLHPRHAEVFEWLCRKFDVHNFCGLSEKTAMRECGFELIQQSPDLTLQSKNTSLRWRRISALAILTVMMMMSSLLWTTFSRSKIQTSTKRGSIWSTTAWLSVSMQPCYLKLTPSPSGHELINHITTTTVFHTWANANTKMHRPLDSDSLHIPLKMTTPASYKHTLTHQEALPSICLSVTEKQAPAQ